MGVFFGLFHLEIEEVNGTDVSGIINSDTVWDMFGSPYIIVGDVLVQSGATLTISPGVEVKFDGFFTMFIDGILNATGTELNRITITSNKTSPQIGDWNRIQLNSSGKGEIAYCDIQFGFNALTILSSSNNAITDNTLKNNSIGIYIMNSTYTNITNNFVSLNNNDGFSLIGSSNNILKENTIVSNKGDGIEVSTSSNNNTISFNNISSNLNSGILIVTSSYNQLHGNDISNNSYAIYIQESTNLNLTSNKMAKNGIMIYGTKTMPIWNSHDIDITNIVNNKPLYYWKNQTGGTIPPDAGQVILANCTNIQVINQSLNYSSVGILMAFSTSSSITFNHVMNNNYGIYLQYSDSNEIESNNVSNGDWGLYVWESNNTYIDNNILINNDMYAISSIRSRFNNITNNSLEFNLGGINYGNSYYGYIAHNNISNNINGLVLSNSKNDTIHNTTFWNNDNGIFLLNSNDNEFHHNLILNNSNQINMDIATSFNNKWDDGMGYGNYWSDYFGVDDGSGGRLANDGVGDTNIPHPIIDKGNGYFQLDDFPLIIPVNFGIPLYKGWNLISLPLVQINTSLDDVLLPIKGSFDAVQYHETNGSLGLWRHNHTKKPHIFNNLETIDHLMGEWIKIDEPGGILFKCEGWKPSVNQSIQLFPGWNLVGYPSLTRRNRTAALNNIIFGPDVDLVQSFNASSKTWNEMGTVDNFELGKGYWIHSRVKKKWDVPL